MVDEFRRKKKIVAAFEEIVRRRIVQSLEMNLES
jgi:hypothetical protein